MRMLVTMRSMIRKPTGPHIPMMLTILMSAASPGTASGIMLAALVAMVSLAVAAVKT